MIRPVTVLSPPEELTLEACSQHAPHHRQRRRALAVLAHSRGQRLPQIAQFFAVRYATAHGWLQAWESGGIAALAEPPRPGRPPLLAPEEKKK